MKQILALLFVTLLAANTNAQLLCDVSCDITVSFSAGGSIEAVEPVTFTFGNNGSLVLGDAGTINTAVQPASIDYSTGGSLSLAAGESITFGSGGLIHLGEDGNLDFVDIKVITDNNVTISGKDNLTISIFTYIGDGVLTFVSEGSMYVDAITANNLALIANGEMIINSLTVDTLDATANSIGEIGSCELGPISGGSITVLSGNIYSLDSNCLTTIPIIMYGDLILEPIEYIYSDESIIINDPLGPRPLTYDEMVVLLDTILEVDGIVLPTSDGVTCTVKSGKCYSEAGVEYVLGENGKLNPVETSSGSLGFWSLFFTLSAMCWLRRCRS